VWSARVLLIALRLLISEICSVCLALPDVNPITRIRFEHTSHAHWSGRSGYTQFVRHLDAQRFRRLLHGASDSNADLAWLLPIWPLLKVLIQRGRMPWYKLSDLNAELFALASCLIGRTDIVHFLDGEHSGQYLPRLVRLVNLSKVRTIVTFHQPPQIANDFVNGDLLRWFDHIVLVSPSQVPFFVQYVPEDRIDVILHGVDVEFFSPAISRGETRDFHCLTVGHWLREWNVLRQIANALPDMTFDVVPAGRQIDFGGLANVHLHHSIDDASLAEVYRRADVLLLPLIDATANNALLEGMASGLPVVVTDLPAIRTYLSSGGVFVPNNSVDGFIAALQSLKRDTGLRHALGRTVRARAEQLAWPRLVPEYEALYRKVLARPAIGRARTQNR